MTGLADDLRADIDDILSIRDDLGVVLKPVFIHQKVWSGSEPGEGTATITRVEMQPSPRAVEITDSYRIREGGTVQAGDVMLKMISRQSYPEITDVDCSVPNQKTEKFYEIGGILYRVISVRVKHLTWTVQVRRVSKQ